jgi:hypothetical protein
MPVLWRPAKGGGEVEIRDQRVLAEVVRVLNEALAEVNGNEPPAKRGPGRPPRSNSATNGAAAETQGDAQPA